MKKKGLSDIVTSLIIILLVLVAIGVVWIVINNVIKGGSQQIEISSKCVPSQITIDSATCNADGSACALTLKRSGGYPVDGINIVFSSATASQNSTQVGDIGTLKVYSGLTGVEGATKVNVAGYFNDAEGNPISCSNAVEGTVTIA